MDSSQVGAERTSLVAQCPGGIGGIVHTWKSLQSLPELFVKVVQSLTLIPVESGNQREGNKIATSVKTGVDLPAVEETLEQQPPRTQKHHRDRYLGDDQQAAQREEGSPRKRSLWCF